MGHDEFAGEVGAARVFVEFTNCLGDVLDAELLDTGINGHGEFAIEDRRPVLAIDVDVVFPKAGVDAVDDVVEVFVDQHRGGAEDDKVVVEDADGIVEVGFSEDKIEQALAFGEPGKLARSWWSRCARS